MWTKRLDEVNQQLRKTEADKTSLTGKLKAAEKDCSTVKARLQELEKTLSANDTKEMEEKLKVSEFYIHYSEIWSLCTSKGKIYFDL